MKRAAVFLVVSFACLSQTFAVLRPLFPAKPEPPLRGGAIIIGDEISARRNHFVNRLVLPNTEMKVAIYSGKTPAPALPTREWAARDPLPDLDASPARHGAAALNLERRVERADFWKGVHRVYGKRTTKVLGENSAKNQGVSAIDAHHRIY